MPCEEVSSRMSSEGLSDMRSNEIVVTIPASWTHRLGRLVRQLRHALHCFEIVLLLGGGEGSPNQSAIHLLMQWKETVPLSADDDVRWVAFLPLLGLLGLVKLLIDTSDTGIEICL